jgi:hypothetical protein
LLIERFLRRMRVFKRFNHLLSRMEGLNTARGVWLPVFVDKMRGHATE